ncbi:hypothetical protein NM208_g7530 [Fusarium decemcellulare]|uniref:Uncharacterized protein n=1 Tax=Fusarium decemcellulare TaxID=57161 RepID=A0ACC1S8Z0_9HYPO|nr:hypothetical protein NM208_g7530 [Fusarium decemcellulare]
MNLCKVCQQVCPNCSGEREAQDPSSVWERAPPWWTLKRLGVMHPSWESFTLSLGHDCPICWAIWRRIQSSPLAELHNERVEGFETEAVAAGYIDSLSVYNIEIMLKARKAKSEVNQKAREAEKEKELRERAKVDPLRMFKTSEYSEWDENGIPTVDTVGSVLSKNRRKKLVKEWENQKKRHEEWLATQQAAKKREFKK